VRSLASLTHALVHGHYHLSRYQRKGSCSSSSLPPFVRILPSRSTARLEDNPVTRFSPEIPPSLFLKSQSGSPTITSRPPLCQTFPRCRCHYSWLLPPVGLHAGFWNTPHAATFHSSLHDRVRFINPHAFGRNVQVSYPRLHHGPGLERCTAILCFQSRGGHWELKGMRKIKCDL
jgi:hypothetical protein